MTRLGLALCRGQICSHRKLRPCPDHMFEAQVLLKRMAEEGLAVRIMPVQRRFPGE